ncbi:hypothetical protein [Streptococcus mitis]|uniref:Uncharacterized protein n=1 Tax=Streptococcus mitis SK597 TaxID=585204 RepID=E1LTH8_STRMT|nr:hypothetical protein [Streptococcus mitis]EFO00167.1 hypothetical protein SMSK597_1269 [Streptococcus mitis SK597]
MNELILPIIFAVSLGFLAGIIALLVYLDSQSKKQPVKEKNENLPPVYTEEEIELAQFLESRQAINEAFLSAQAELLKELRK